MDPTTFAGGSSSPFYVVAILLTALVFRVDWRGRLARLGDDPPPSSPRNTGRR